MKKVVFIFALIPAVLSLNVDGQNQTGQSGTTSSSKNDNSITTNTSASSTTTTSSGRSSTNTTATSASASGVIVTNKEGQTYTVDQLAQQLKTLRGTVDQIMPMLQAFNETYSNSVSGDRTLTGKLSGLLSNSLRRNESATNASNNTSTQSSDRYGNVVDALQKLLAKDNPNSPPISANTIRDLESLYGQLQPVGGTLQNLNVNIGAGNSGTTTNNASGLTPTGKSSGKQ